jgi:preprotein translocase subunit SecY
MSVIKAQKNARHQAKFISWQWEHAVGQSQIIILPGVDSAYFSSINKVAAIRGNVSIFTLGYLPFLNGFIVVSIFSLIVPFGRRMRCSGSAGRAKLNRAAMITSVLLCVIQSQAIALAMEKASAVEGISPVPIPGWLFRLSTCVTLTAEAIFLEAWKNCRTD